MSSTEKSTESISHDNTSLEGDLEQNKAKPAAEEVAEDDTQYITGIPLVLMVLALCMAVLLVGLVCALLFPSVRH
jgi:F0F1-type ATP synthase membrane subunit c/vacuolar-type H+-ATPase subunit K